MVGRGVDAEAARFTNKLDKMISEHNVVSTDTPVVKETNLLEKTVVDVDQKPDVETNGEWSIEDSKRQWKAQGVPFSLNAIFNRAREKGIDPGQTNYIGAFETHNLNELIIRPVEMARFENRLETGYITPLVIEGNGGAPIGGHTDRLNPTALEAFHNELQAGIS